MARWWNAVDVTRWKAVAYETHGIRSKCWIVAPDGSRWLRKEPRHSRPYEPAIENFALELARRVGVNAAQASACEFREAKEWKRGFIARYFLDQTVEELRQGDQVLHGLVPGYDPEVRAAHTVVRVRDALDQLEQVHNFARRSFGPNAVLLNEPLRAQIFSLLVFDCWIGNGDRHPGNWATIGRYRQTGGFHWMDFRLAPMYDPASCLGVELQDQHPLLRPAERTNARLEKYVERCPSGFGDGQKLIPLAEVLRQLQGWPEWATRAQSLIASYRSCLDNEVEGLLWGIPDDWLPEPRKELAWTLLHRRLNLLENIAQSGSTG